MSSPALRRQLCPWPPQRVPAAIPIPAPVFTLMGRSAAAVGESHLGPLIDDGVEACVHVTSAARLARGVMENNLGMISLQSSISLDYLQSKQDQFFGQHCTDHDFAIRCKANQGMASYIPLSSNSLNSTT